MTNLSLTQAKNTLKKLLLIPPRLVFALSYFYGPLKNIFQWLIHSNETSNFTYDITDTNKRYLASFVAVVTGIAVDKVQAFIKELENDRDLKHHIVQKTMLASNRSVADARAEYGRRLGWYALVRAKKPKVVVETGVDKGLGSCVIAAALMKNAAEGYEGYYYGTDIMPSAGYLFDYPYKKYGEILYGDSIESLKKFNKKIDLFINDSDHSQDYEAREYTTIQDKLSNDSVIVGDNAHATDKLWEFAQKTGLDFLFFQEKPKDHWYPGCGIGVAFRKRR